MDLEKAKVTNQLLEEENNKKFFQELEKTLKVKESESESLENQNQNLKYENKRSEENIEKAKTELNKEEMDNLYLNNYIINSVSNTNYLYKLAMFLSPEKRGWLIQQLIQLTTLNSSSLPFNFPNSQKSKTQLNNEFETNKEE